MSNTQLLGRGGTCVCARVQHTLLSRFPTMGFWFSDSSTDSVNGSFPYPAHASIGLNPSVCYVLCLVGGGGGGILLIARDTQCDDVTPLGR